MSTLYVFLFGLLLIALGVIAIPFARHKKLCSPYFVMIGITLIILTGTLYRYSANSIALQKWFTGGAEHYQLMEKFNELGGVDGAIRRIEEKLATDPNDAAGWVLVGKLYLGKQDMLHAKEAFDRAHTLKPNDAEISRYYDAVNKP
jgi:cytochrome c-type biogenesis protein CcmH/NrfG